LVKNHDFCLYPTCIRHSRYTIAMNASVTSQTAEEGFAIRICQRRLSIFGHVRRLQEAKRHQPTPHYVWLWTRAGGKSDIRLEWNCQRGRPCRTWVQQIEDDTGLNAKSSTTPGKSHMTASLGGRYNTTRGRSSVPVSE